MQNFRPQSWVLMIPLAPFLIFSPLLRSNFFLAQIWGWWVSNELPWPSERRTENHFQKYAPSHEKSPKNLLKMAILIKWAIFTTFLHFSCDWVHIFENGFQFCIQRVKTVHLIPINPIFEPKIFLTSEGGLKFKMELEQPLEFNFLT